MPTKIDEVSLDTGAKHYRTETSEVKEQRSQGFAFWVLIAIYAVAVGVTIAHHEPWADEAQAWLIAKNLPFWRMFFGQVRYEGTPGLWHAILWVLSHLGLPYGSMLWFSWAAAVAATWCFVRWAPFPWLIRGLIPFGFYFSYQFAVVGRSYVLMPLLVFGANHLIRTRSKRSILFGVVLGLLANCNIFGLFISAGLMIVYALRTQTYPSWLPSTMRLGLIAAVPWLALVGIAVATAAPPKDQRSVPTPLGNLLNHYRGVQATLPDTPDERTLRNRVQDYTTPLSHSLWVGLLFLIVMLWELRTRRSLFALIPVGFLMLSFELVYRAPWHTGLFLLILIAALWLAWPEPGLPLHLYRPADLICTGLLFLMSLPHVAWGLRAMRYDLTHDYSGSKGCADYLKAHANGKKVFGYDYYTVAVSPYFEKPIFANQPTQYWSWSVNNVSDLQMNRIVWEKPDYVVIAWNQNVQFGYEISTNLSPSVPEMREYMRRTGYTRAALFYGAQVMRSSFSERDFFEVYRKPDFTPAQWALEQYELYVPPGIHH